MQRAVRETLGFDVRVEGRVGDGAPSPASPPATAPGAAAAPPRPAGSERPTGSGRPTGSERPGSAPRATPPTPAGVVDRAAAEASWATVEPPDDDIPEGPPVDSVPPDLEPPAPSGQSGSSGPSGRAAPPASSGGRPSAREAGERAHAAATRRSAGSAPLVEDSPSPDDPDLASSGLTGQSLVAQMLGGTVIDEQLGDGV